MLAGYPIEGYASAPQDAGKLQATAPANVSFAQLLDRVYATPMLTGFPGNSGGPLYVRADSGAFFPAAVYLGGTSQTLVRAIDDDVADLINRAETVANGGTNNASGGVTLVAQGQTTAQFSTGTVAVDLEPAAARAAGAAWRIQSRDAAFRATSTSPTPLTAGTYTIEFRQTASAANFLTPDPVTINVLNGQSTTITAIYGEPVVISGAARPRQGGSVTGGTFRKGVAARASAIPALGFHFEKWTENGAAVSFDQVYRFTAERSLLLSAKFKAGPYVALQGAYAGLATGTDAGAGYLSLTLDAAGRFSAAFFFEGRRRGFKGRFDSAGQFSRIVDSQTGLGLELHIDVTGATPGIAGRMRRDGQTVGLIEAGRSPFSKKQPVESVGRYTVHFRELEDAATLKRGTGYGALNVKADGTLRFTGVLGDGTAVSQGVHLLAGREWPLFLPSHGNRGYAAGTVFFRKLASGNLDGLLDWLLPAAADPRYAEGFRVQLGAEGLRYVPPPKRVRAVELAAGVLGIGALGGDAAIEQPFTLNRSNVLLFEDGSGLTASIDPATGLFTGKLKVGASKRKFGGAIRQPLLRGEGVLSTGDGAAAVTLGPAPGASP